MSNVAKLPSKSFAPINPDNPGDASFPHKLPIELAMGLNTPRDICASYGLTKDDLVAIYAIPQFHALLEWAKEVRLEPNGIFRLQMVMMSDDIAKTIWMAMTDAEGGMAQRLRAAELAAKLGGLEAPKQVPPADSNEKFSIVVNFPASARDLNPERPVIDVQSR